MKRTMGFSVQQLSDHHFGCRMLFALVAGVVIAGALTYFMHRLILSSHHQLDETLRTSFLDFVRLKREEHSQRKQSKLQRPRVQQAPQAPTSPQVTPQLSDNRIEISQPSVAPQVQVDIGTLGIGSGDGEYLPIVKVAPVYPFKAMSDGVEGNCLVEYTVTASGATNDVHIVKGQCKRVFAAASIKAARKFKYKPRVINGEAISVPNVRNLFKYELEER